MNCWLYDFFPPLVARLALEAAEEYIMVRWGNGIQYAGYQHILLDAYNFLLIRTR
jgi:hypothetical protein